MNKIYEVWSVVLSDGRHHSWGAYRTREAAEERLTARSTGDNAEWAANRHGRWWIEEVDTTGLFQIPPGPSPRERFTAHPTTIETGEGTWNTLRVDVKDSTETIVATYNRNYSSFYRTFEPFRQGDRMFALVSLDYTCTSILDLQSGEIIGGEEPDGAGFCPVGFYVPDWWDINDESILPGSNGWRDDYELPKGDFGFVWGCIWGDDSSWKVQYLDLSRVQEGEITREERFGYLKLAANPELDAEEFIDCYFYGGKWSVTFAVEITFDLQTGERTDVGDPFA